MKALPPIPKTMPSALGPIPVRIKPGPLKPDGEPVPHCLGYYTYEGREIVLRDDLKDRPLWAVLFHEWVHVILVDSGCKGLSEEQHEFVADAMATGLTAAMLAGRLTLK